MLDWLYTNTIEVAYWFCLWNLLHFVYTKLKRALAKGEVHDSGES